MWLPNVLFFLRQRFRPPRVYRDAEMCVKHVGSCIFFWEWSEPRRFSSLFSSSFPPLEKVSDMHAYFLCECCWFFPQSLRVKIRPLVRHAVGLVLVFLGEKFLETLGRMGDSRHSRIFTTLKCIIWQGKKSTLDEIFKRCQEKSQKM